MRRSSSRHGSKSYVVIVFGEDGIEHKHLNESFFFHQQAKRKKEELNKKGFRVVIQKTRYVKEKEKTTDDIQKR